MKPITKVKNAIAGSIKASNVEKAAADPNAPPWIKQVAMITGVLAGLAGFLTVRSTTLTDNAIYQSNQAILAQTQASDAWAEYQADSVKARIVETQLVSGSTLNAAEKAELKKTDDDFRARQPANRQTAAAKMQERDAHLKDGMAQLGQKNLLEYAGMAAQLGIALASVAALTHKRFAFNAGIAAGVLGVALTLYAMLG